MQNVYVIIASIIFLAGEIVLIKSLSSVMLELWSCISGIVSEIEKGRTFNMLMLPNIIHKGQKMYDPEIDKFSQEIGIRIIRLSHLFMAQCIILVAYIVSIICIL